MSSKVRAFDGKALVVVELNLPVQSGLVGVAEDVLESLAAIDPKMAAAVKEVLEEMDPDVPGREIYLGDSSKGEIEITRIERIAINPFWMQVDVTVLMRPGGNEAPAKEFTFRSIRWNRGIVNGVAVLPLCTDGRIVFVREFKHAVRRWCLHLPRGLRKDGESDEACGLREAGEEAGVTTSATSTVADLGAIEPDTGVLASRPQLLVVTDVVVDESIVNRDQTETNGGTVVMSWSEVCEAVRTGEILDSFTRAALFQAFLHGYLS